MVAAVTVLLVLLLRGGRREEEVMEVVEVVLRAVSIVVSIVMDGDGSDGGGAIAACRRCRSSVRRASPLIPGVLVGNPSSFNALRTVVRSIFNCKVSDSKNQGYYHLKLSKHIYLLKFRKYQVGKYKIARLKMKKGS
jgi:hypothetical protein